MRKPHASLRLVHPVRFALSHIAGGLRKRSDGNPGGAIIAAETWCRAPPVADQRLPACKRCQRRGVGPQDARTEAHRRYILYATKGLEFDFVVLVEPSAGLFPDTPSARRVLHVAATRAIHQLWVTCVGAPSPILEAALAER